MPLALTTLAPADSDTYPPLSALNDLLFCPRRCFMHRVEGVWVENAHTTAGSFDHRRAHRAGESNAEGGLRTVRGLWVVSHTLRVAGVCDLVEFHPRADGAEVPCPVEYKRGKRRRWDNDEVQLCAQAIALEEMLGVAIPAGAIFHVKSKRRREVPLSPQLRRDTVAAAERLHQLLAQTVAPAPVVHPKCKQCSLYSLCLPELIAAPSAYRRAAEALFRPS